LSTSPIPGSQSIPSSLSLEINNELEKDFYDFLFKKVSSWAEKGAKLGHARVLINKEVTKNEIKKVSSWGEKGGKLPKLRLFENKEVMENISQKVVSVLQKGGKLFDKPRSSKQKYVITEKGQRQLYFPFLYQYSKEFHVFDEEDSTSLSCLYMGRIKNN